MTPSSYGLKAAILTVVRVNISNPQRIIDPMAHDRRNSHLTCSVSQLSPMTKPDKNRIKVIYFVTNSSTEPRKYNAVISGGF